VLLENTWVIADIKDDEFKESTGVRQCAELKRLAPFHSGKTRRRGAFTRGCRDSDQAESTNPKRGEEADLVRRPVKAKNSGKSRRAQILNPSNELVSETTWRRHDYSCRKGPEERVNADKLGAQRRGTPDRKNES
jgi:hypothetical protein